MNKSSKKVENEKMKNKLNDEIDVENMEIANFIKRTAKIFQRFLQILM